MVARSTDHVERAQGRLRDTFKKPRYKAWLAVYIEPVQNLENALWEIRDGRMLADAVGEQQNVIGRIVGRGRNSLPDEHYLLAIRTQIRINRSQGRTTDMTDVVALSVPDGTSLEIRESAIATTYVTVGPGDYDLATLIANMEDTRTLGTKLFLLLWYEDGPSGGFTWAPAGGVPVADDPGVDERGWSSVDGTRGGLLSHLIEVS